jgi:Ca2+-dependent lipid-binding protein
MVVYFGEEIKTTRAIQQTINPKWKETVNFGGGMINKKLRIEVRDSSKQQGSSDLIGKTELKIKDPIENNVYEIILDLNTKGTIRIEYIGIYF